MFGNVLGNLGNLAKLKSMQDALKKEELTHTADGYTIIVRGDMQIKDILVHGISDYKLVKAINEAISKVQQESAKKLMQMGG